MKYLADQIGEEYKNWKDDDIVLITAPTGIGKTTFILKILLPYIMQKGGQNVISSESKSVKGTITGGA
jgi:flagellar biosynthesis GTPase FlhF